MRAIRMVRLRLRSLFRRGQVARDLGDELRDHLERETERLVAAGLAPAAARDAARREFGNVTLIQEQVRESWGLRLLDETAQDLRSAIRSLARYPGFSLVAISTLALGIGANTAIFTLLDAVVFKPLPVPAARELVTFYETGPEGAADPSGGTGRFLRFSYPRFKRLQEALGPAGQLAAVTRNSRFIFHLPGSTGPRFLLAQLASGEYFGTLGIRASRGRLISADDDRLDRLSMVAVVSDAFRSRVFGADDPIGKTLVVNNVAVTVIGVAPAGFTGIWTDSEAELWLPLSLQRSLRYDNNSSGYGTIDRNAPWQTQDLLAWLNLVGRIPSPGRAAATVRLQAANQQGLRELTDQFTDPATRPSMLAHALVVEPFAHGFSGLRARFSDALYLLGALVGLVLLVTCANLANLLLARAAGRARDISIRVSLGATTGRLVRQHLTESLTLAAIGGAAGFFAGGWTSRLLAHEVLGTSSDLPAVFAPDSRVLAFAAAISIATAMAFGLAPARRAIRAGRLAAAGMNQRLAVGRAGLRGMRTLVAVQVALSAVVVVAAMLLGRTLVNFMHIDPGFSTAGHVTVSFDTITSGYSVADMSGLAERLTTAVRAVPGVSAAAASRCGLIAGCSSSSSFRISGTPERRGVSLQNNWVTPGYFGTVGIPLAAGREFTDRDVATGFKVAIINESAARLYFPGQHPLARRLGFDELDTEIVGVARDARTQNLHDAAVPMVYFPVGQNVKDVQTVALTNMDVRVSGDERAVLLALPDVIRRAEPRLLVSGIAPMSRRLARDLGRERVVAWLAGAFGALTLLLASLGLYGVLSYSVARRTQEIGVRAALGARRGEIVRLVLGESLRTTLIGIAIGGVAAVWVAGYLSTMLFGVAPRDLATFVAVAALFGAVSMLAGYLPARRASRVDPVVALRCE